MTVDFVSYILTFFWQPGGDPHVLCFVDFDNPAQATIALEALQGEHAYICGYGLFTYVVIGETYFVQLYYKCLHSTLFCCQVFWETNNHT